LWNSAKRAVFIIEAFTVSLTDFTSSEVEAIESNSIWPRFLIAPIGLTCELALAFYWPNEHWAWQVCWTVITAYVFLCWTSCFHEASHQTICGSRTFSVWVGRVIGTFIFVPYSVYRESHIRHHAYLNKPTDWELWPYSDPSTSLWFRRIFCWLEIPLGVVTTPFAYARLYFHPRSPLTNAKVRREIGWEYVGMVATWSLLLGVVTATQTWETFIRAWLIPHYVAALFQVTRKFTEHLGMQSYDPLLGARTVMGRSWLTKIACYFNFDIFLHGPHHRHPRASTNQLCQKMADYQRENSDVEYPVFSSYWSAIKDMLPAIANPGVGMNAGGSAPDDEKSHADDFVVDVTKEILSDADNGTTNDISLSSSLIR
jgi:fatty acid desaturase